MKRAELEAALKVCEAATPGPWEEHGMLLTAQAPLHPSMSKRITVFSREADVAFCASARTLLPALIRWALRALPVVEAAEVLEVAERETTHDAEGVFYASGEFCDVAESVAIAVRAMQKEEG